MTPQSTTQLRRILAARRARVAIAALVAVVATLGADASASAGGWAVTSLDEVPVAVAGEPVDVGFTVLQHGVSPVDLTEDVGIEVTAADGTTSYFAATAEGSIGHYVATVTFPADGEYTWRARQGWFAPHELGTISIGGEGGASTTGGAGWASGARPVLLASCLVLALAAIVDTVAGRRRRTGAVT
jgi:hypothetical protein